MAHLKKLLFCLIVVAASCGSGDALDSAKQFAARSYPGAKDVSCVGGMGADSDGDGYVSCQIVTKDDKVIPLKCGTNHTGCGSSGCKVVPSFF